MRIIGFVFVIVLILAAVGYVRGWFSVTTTHASGSGDVAVAVDNDKIRADTNAAAAELGRLSAKAMAAVNSMAKKVGPEESELEAAIETTDPVGRDLVLAIGSRSVDLHVQTTVPITRDGAAADFDQLRPATRAKFVFRHSGEDRQLARIEILQ